MTLPSTTDPEIVAARFNRLVSDLLEGRGGRTEFQPWEVALLLDIDACTLQRSIKRERLKRYQKAVNRALAKGCGQPFLFSDYIRGSHAVHAASSRGHSEKTRSVPESALS